MPYIECTKKSNRPRRDIRICQARCDIKDECDKYLDAVVLYDLEPEVPLDNDFDPLAGTPLVSDPLTGLCEIDPLAGC